MRIFSPTEVGKNRDKCRVNFIPKIYLIPLGERIEYPLYMGEQQQ
jgi:hypothetical protein